MIHILTLAYFYVKSASIYWLYENKIAVNLEAMFNDEVKMQRFYRLFDYVESMNTHYEKRYPQIFKKLNDPYYKNYLNYKTTDYIMDDLMDKKNQDICNESNRYVDLHFNSKSNLLNIYTTEGKLGKKSLNKLFRNSIDEKFKIFCKIQGEKR